MTTAVRIYETTDIEAASTNTKCTHMDRQRVVHLAKSRTAKVIRPGCVTRQTSSELPPAPLASIDSDFVVITKRRDETNTAPNVWDQLGKSMPQTNFSIQAIDGDSVLFDRGSFYSEHSGLPRPRTYVKLRSEQDPCADLGEKQKLHPIGVRSRHLQGHSIVNSGQDREPSGGKSVPPCIHQTKTALPHETNCPTHRSIPHKQNAKTDYDKPQNCVNRINGHTYNNTKQTVTVRKLPANARGNVFSQSPATTVWQHVGISEHNSNISAPCLPTSLSIKPRNDGPHEVNRAGWSRDHPTKEHRVVSPKTPTDVSRKDISRPNCSHPCVAPDKLQQDTNASHNSVMEDPCSVIIPEFGMLHLNRLDTREEPLPELCGISSSVYTSNIRLASERIARAFIGPSGDHKDNPSHHPCLNNAQPCRDVRIVNDTQSRHKQDPTSLQPHQDLLSTRTVNQSSVSQNGGDHYKRELPTSNDCTPVSEPELCWKRTSPTPATNGNSSIQDLVSSFDYLTRLNQDSRNIESTPSLNRSYDNRQGAHSEKSSNVSCSDGQKFLHVQTGKSRINDANTHFNNDKMNDNKFTDTNNSKKRQQSPDSVDRSDPKQLSFRLAPTGVSDVWLVERNVCDRSDAGRKEWVSVEKNKSGISDMAWRYIALGRLTKQTPAKDRSEAAVSCHAHQHNSNLDKQSLEETFNTLKRRSFMLATRSMSDLTFPDDDAKCENPCHRHNLQKYGHQDFRDFHKELRSSSSIYMTPDSLCRRRRNDSLSSDCHNSSFGSFYSCQSQNSNKSQPRRDVTADKDKAQSKRHSGHRYRHLSNRHNALEDSIDSDSSMSGDTSVYYTASDTSFRTSGGTSSNVLGMNQANQQSPRPPLPAQWRASHSNHNQRRLQSKADPYSVFRNANTLPHGVRSSKQTYPKSFLHCYGCGLDEGIPGKTYNNGRRNNSRGVTNRNRFWVNPDYLQGKARQERKRSRSVPSSRCARRSDSSSKQVFSVHPHAGREPHVPPNNQSCGSVRDSSISGSLNSLLLDDSTWESMPRIPPSLGRPRRKLYAGFDSQPLPMDSFLSDSSSVYSTHSCSSWGTSKSAMVEGTSRTLDMSSTARSASSISSTIATPTRHDDVFEFFTYSGKRSSACENNYNLYLGSETTFTDECFQDRFYDKTYSKDSLESVLSNGTTVNVEHMLYIGSTLDELKPDYNSAPGGNDLNQNNDAAGFLRRESPHNDKNNFNRLNNDCVGSKLYKNCNGVISATSKNQQSQIKAPPSKDSFLSKRKYFSTRDILDLVMASETNYTNSQRRSRSLERQAQKMCEVILCLN